MEGQSVDDVDDGPSTPEVLPRSERPIPYITTTLTRKKRQLLVVGDCLLRGTEAPIGQTDPPLREVYCPQKGVTYNYNLSFLPRGGGHDMGARPF